MEQYNVDTLSWIITVLDSEGYRSNVGIIVANSNGQLLWARRTGVNAWQFPQGGIQSGESDYDAMFRELNEELGLKPADVDVIESTRGWLKYRFPPNLIRENSHPVCIGQKQRWFLLRLISDDGAVVLNLSDEPEFDGWRWVEYWYPLDQVVEFKREVYRQALERLEESLCLAIEKDYD